MWSPAAFREERLDVLHKAIQESGLATIVSVTSEGIIATHVPTVLVANEGPYGTLYGHFARDNPHAKVISSEIDALAIFQGPDAYITPTWYATKKVSPKVVPTWDYVTVHASGPLQIITETETLLKIVNQITDKHEAGRAEPWKVSDAPENYISVMLKGIVGFSIPITKIGGKWKMSQNRPQSDRVGVIEGLREEGNHAAADLIPSGPDAPQSE
jgi:transcriptional regulator